VLEGVVELHTDVYAPTRLSAGESIYYDSGMGHAFLAVSPGPCRILSICSHPESPHLASVPGANENASDPVAPADPKAPRPREDGLKPAPVGA
jgi:hypothetical protein